MVKGDTKHAKDNTNHIYTRTEQLRGLGNNKS